MMLTRVIAAAAAAYAAAAVVTIVGVEQLFWVLPEKRPPTSKSRASADDDEIFRTTTMAVDRIENDTDCNMPQYARWSTAFSGYYLFLARHSGNGIIVRASVYVSPTRTHDSLIDNIFRVRFTVLGNLIKISFS